MFKSLLVVMVCVIVSGCTSDTRSMWHSKYAFKTVGQVMGMCEDGDNDACYAARDMGAMQVGLNNANNIMVQQQQLQIQQQQAAAAAMPKTITCTPSIGNSVSCTQY
ncbi:hypothetical protein PXY30_004455 [Salmonella enterica]|nr:hypothetical protein [Salmonella enterica]